MDGRMDGRTHVRTSGNTPLCPTGHRPFGAAPQKRIQSGLEFTLYEKEVGQQTLPTRAGTELPFVESEVIGPSRATAPLPQHRNNNIIGVTCLVLRQLWGYSGIDL